MIFQYQYHKNILKAKQQSDSCRLSSFLIFYLFAHNKTRFSLWPKFNSIFLHTFFLHFTMFVSVWVGSKTLKMYPTSLGCIEKLKY